MSTNNKWQALSMSERAFLIREAVRNGITDINSIRDTWEHRFDGNRDIVDGGEIPSIVVTPDSKYTKFVNSLPDNQRDTPESEYYTHLGWKLYGKPEDFEEAKHRGMYHFDNSDQSYHGNSVAWDDKADIGYFLKPKHHETVKYELDWYNKGLETLEGGEQRPLTGKDREFWQDFKSKYKLEESGSDYKYIPRHHIFDGESNQPTEEKPWYKKLASAISEGARMARDARIGAVGAEPIRQLYWEGKTEEAQELAEQYAKANIAGISAALGKTTDAILPNILNLAGAVSASALVSDGFKNNKESKPVIYSNTPTDKIPSMRTAEEDMMQRIERVENKKNKKGGWNNEKRIWFAHDSYEGGAPTIGYGIKLNKGTKAREVFDRQGYLTEAQEREFRTELMQNALRQAKKSYDKKFGTGQFDLLDFKAQSLLGDKEYNVTGGISTFPKLMAAVHNNDIEEIKKQVITKAKKKGSKKFLTLGNRNDDFLQDIDSLKQGIYNIYKK